MSSGRSSVVAGLIISAIGVCVAILGLRISRQSAVLSEEVNRPLIQFGQVETEMVDGDAFWIKIPLTNVGATTGVTDSREIYLLPFVPDYYHSEQMTACRASIKPLFGRDQASSLDVLEPHTQTVLDEMYDGGQDCTSLWMW